MSVKWLRLHVAVLDNPKVQLLPIELRWRWIEVLCLSAENNGVIPSLRNAAFRLRITEAEMEQILESLQSAGLVDSEEGFRPHDWDAWQYRDSTNALRQQMFRERQKKGNVTETGDNGSQTGRNALRNDQIQIQNTDTDNKKTIQKSSAAKASGVLKEIESDFTEFWAAYPRREGKLAALKAYAKARQSVDKTRLHEAAVAYANRRAGEDPKFTPHAATWLNRGSWEDIPPSSEPSAAGPREVPKEEAASNFEIFWQAFPRKDNRDSTFAVYCEAVKWVQPDEICTAAKMLRKEADANQAFAPPHANSWLMENFISRRRILVDKKSSMWKNGIASVA